MSSTTDRLESASSESSTMCRIERSDSRVPIDSATPGRLFVDGRIAGTNLQQVATARPGVLVSHRGKTWHLVRNLQQGHWKTSSRTTKVCVAMTCTDRLPETELALLWSQDGPVASALFVSFSATGGLHPEYRCAACDSAIPMSVLACRCGRPLDVLGHHLSARCPWDSGS